MKFRAIAAVAALAAALTVNAQTPTVTTPGAMPFGKIDKADLEMKVCDFEKDANAMVLFDKADIYYDAQFLPSMERHKRIKIFNEHGKNAANIRLEFYSASHYEYITGLQAQTINLGANGQIEITKLDKKTLFLEVVDKARSAYVFSFPNIKPGSIIEFKYTLGTQGIDNLPDWEYQSEFPTRYSELTTQIPDLLYFRQHSRVLTPFAINKSSAESRSVGYGAESVGYNLEINKRALVNIHSLTEEPYMRSMTDNVQGVSFQLISVRPVGGFVKTFSDSWAKVGGRLADDEDFGGQFKRRLKDEEALITKAKAMKTDVDKIAFLFNEVRNNMKWDGVDRWYTNDGTVKAWEKKTGNSAEVNLILYHLLKQANVKVYPMVVSTRKHGRVDPTFTSLVQFNRAVVYAPIDSATYFILDATGKYNMYNQTPEELLNSTGLYINKEDKTYDTKLLTRELPPGEMIVVNGSIAADGRMNGTLLMNFGSYNKINAVKRYKTDGEKKYLDYLRNNDNTIKLAALKLENMEADSLPLAQTINFDQELTGSDGNFIYFVPSLFTPLRKNPFVNENRFTDIDFGYRDNFTMTGSYKLPAGFKSETLPKNITLEMPDKSIIFRRFVIEQEGSVMVRYNVDFKQTIFYKENYPELRDFYKKMSEMLNEQIVLKKA